MIYPEDEFNWSSNYKLNEDKKMSGHSIRTVLGLAIVFVIGGLQAWHGQGGYGAWVDTLLAVALAVEHGFKGNTQ